MFSEMDYTDYMSDASPSTIESIRKTLDDAMYRYVSVLLSQPFDVAKTILQVKRQDGDMSEGITMKESAQSRREERPYSDVCGW
jgi:fusion and transport protein UGO1